MNRWKDTISPTTNTALKIQERGRKRRRKRKKAERRSRERRKTAPGSRKVKLS